MHRSGAWNPSSSATARREQQVQSEALVAQEQQAGAQAQAREAQRLARLRQHGDQIAAMSGAPVEYCAAVTRDLVSYVTAEQFPVSATWQAHQYVQARVERTLRPWREQQAKDQERAEHAQQAGRDRLTCASLIATGVAHAENQVVTWDDDAADEARRLIARDLRDEVKPDWTPRDVVELVDEILDEWE